MKTMLIFPAGGEWKGILNLVVDITKATDFGLVLNKQTGLFYFTLCH